MERRRSTPLLFLCTLAVACNSGGGGQDSGVDRDGSPIDGASLLDGAPDAVPAAPGIRLVGRADYDDVAGPRFEWSGTQIQAVFTGSSVAVQLDEEWGSNQYELYLDDQRQAVLETSAGVGRYQLGSDLGDGEHELLLHRRTEAFFGPTQFLGLEFAEGGELLPPPPAPGRRIEVIGDSISAGYGNEGADQYCDFTAATENHYLTYGAVAARELGANLITTAWSGIGLYRNYDGGTDGTMPVRYLRTIPTDAESEWDFAGWHPDVVVINLGTNDFAQGTPAQEAFTATYLQFARDIRLAYPEARIICALGPMMAGSAADTARSYIQAVVTELQTADDRVHFLEFAVQEEANGYGCDWHPSLATHAIMAATLVSEIRSLLDW